MATRDSPPRAWRAACPNCGAPVEFASAASPVAVCSYCRTTLARDGDTLRRIGRSAELFEDHSPLQLGVSGRWQGRPFTLVGRLQMRYADGLWNEWHALFTAGPQGEQRGWLSEDNGRYVMAFDAPLPGGALPEFDRLVPGERTVLGHEIWEVASVVVAHVGAAQGELPGAPKLDGEYRIIELRSAQGEVGTLDFADPARPAWSVGRSVALDELQLSGLRAESEAQLAARGVQCPSCGAALEVKLDTTRTIVCRECHAVVDVSQGVGGDLAHYAQGRPPAGGEPLLPLGSTATLALGGPAQRWQVVGYVERCEVPEGDDDERTCWREYLLYAPETGFAFIVDAEDGWTWSVPLTGAPSGSGETVRWDGQTWRRLYSYTGEITWVLGEFYWKLERGERTRNTDYASGDRRLYREETAAEVTWSIGGTLDAKVIAAAFKLPPERHAALAREASPVSGGGSSVVRTMLVVALSLLLIGWLMYSCSRDECDQLRDTFGASSNEYQQCRAASASGLRSSRTSGGSFGGFGTGGGHK